MQRYNPVGMRLPIALLVVTLLTGAVAALEPDEIYERGSAATVEVRTDKGSGLGVAIDAEHVLTPLAVIDKAKSIRIRTTAGKTHKAALIALDIRAQLALLKVEGYAGGTVPIAPALGKPDEIVGRRVYAIGRPQAGKTEWRFFKGVATALAARKDLVGLVVLESDVGVEDVGAPLLDAEARLVGLALSGERAIPVNALRRLLARNGFPKLALPKNAVKVIDRASLVEPPEPQKPATKKSAAFEIPEGLAFGPYRHSFESRERRLLTTRVGNILRGLAGIWMRCPRCGGAGEIRVRENRHPPLFREITCPHCKGAKKLFNPGRAERVYLGASRAGRGNARDYSGALADFVKRCRKTGNSYRKGPAYSVEVKGRFGIARGAGSARSDPLFPLRFRLVAVRGEYRWFFHDDRTNGPFDMEREAMPLPASARVAGVAAGDILVLEGGRIVRICGIAVADINGKLPTSHIAPGNEIVRKHVEKLLAGKTVRLFSDKYAKVTLDGHAIAFVETDGGDIGEALLRIGLVRRHPKHAHIRMNRYKKAESAARKDLVGLWKR